jgi:hypothetical protein
MTTLRQKVIVLVSAIVVTLALVVLPGCKKNEPAKTVKKPAAGAKKDAASKME